jgi:outer membrane protein
MNSMRLIIVFLLIWFNQANAQSFAYIDSDYILSSIPEYTESKAKLDKLAETWTKDIEDRFNIVKTQKGNSPAN